MKSPGQKGSCLQFSNINKAFVGISLPRFRGQENETQRTRGPPGHPPEGSWLHRFGYCKEASQEKLHWLFGSETLNYPDIQKATTEVQTKKIARGVPKSDPPPKYTRSNQGKNKTLYIK